MLSTGARLILLNRSGTVHRVSAPAYRRGVAALVSQSEAEAVVLGSAERSNHRTIRKYVHADGIESNQLVLGITTLEPARSGTPRRRTCTTGGRRPASTTGSGGTWRCT